jgi:hypothetical protein
MWKYFRIPKLYENELSKGENVQEKSKKGEICKEMEVIGKI